MINQSLRDKIAVPYAEALLNIANSRSLLSESVNDLSSVSGVLSQSIELQELLSNPLVSSLLKKETLKNLFEKQLNDFVLNFLLVLVDRRRIYLLSNIIGKYLKLTSQLQSVTIVEVFSAVDFSDSQKEALNRQIKLMTQTNEVKLITHKQPHLIGGFVAKIGSKVIDASLAGKLNNISFYLNAN